MQIFINTLIAWHTTGETPRIERILYANIQANLIYTINIAEPEALPIAHKYSDISAALQYLDATIAIEEPNLLRLMPPKPTSDSNLKSYQRWENRSKKLLQRRDEAWKVIEPLVYLPGIFDPIERGRLITQRVNETGTIKKTIYGYLRRYWQGGMLKNTLLPFYINSGAKASSESQKPQSLDDLMG